LIARSRPEGQQAGLRSGSSRPWPSTCDIGGFFAQSRGAIRSFGIAIVVAVVLAIGFAVVLNANQKTAQEEFSTEAVRL
jgi:hypothetical protein